MRRNFLNVKAVSSLGPGGWRCPCCAPAPKHRKAAARTFKHRTYHQLDRELRNDIIKETAWIAR